MGPEDVDAGGCREPLGTSVLDGHQGSHDGGCNRRQEGGGISKEGGGIGYESVVACAGTRGVLDRGQPLLRRVHDCRDCLSYLTCRCVVRDGVGTVLAGLHACSPCLRVVLLRHLDCLFLVRMRYDARPSARWTTPPEGSCCVGRVMVIVARDEAGLRRRWRLADAYCGSVTRSPCSGGGTPFPPPPCRCDLQMSVYNIREWNNGPAPQTHTDSPLRYQTRQVVECCPGMFALE